MEGGGGDKGVAGATPLPRRDISSTQPEFFFYTRKNVGCMKWREAGKRENKKVCNFY